MPQISKYTGSVEAERDDKILKQGVELAKQLGLKPAGTTDQSPRKKRARPLPFDRIAEHYYKNWQGKITLAVCRFAGKGPKVLPFTPADDEKDAGLYFPGIIDRENLLLYGIPSLKVYTEIKPSDKSVCIVEGEKCVDAAGALGQVLKVPVLTWQGGSNAFHKQDWQPLRGFSILLLPDHDLAGVICMWRLANEHLLPLGCKVKISYDQTKAGTGYDLADAVRDKGREGAREWMLDNKVPLEEFESVAQAAADEKAAGRKAANEVRKDKRRADARADISERKDERKNEGISVGADEAMAHEFVRLLAGRHLWNINANRWIEFSPDTGWSANDKPVIKERLKDYLWNFVLTSRQAQEGVKEREKFAKEIRGYRKKRDVLALTQESLLTVEADWNKEKYILGVPDGYIDLRKGATVCRPDKAVRVERATSISPAAVETPNWDRFLNDLTGGDGQLQNFIVAWAGLCLTGEMREHKFLFLWGAAGTGKSTLTEILSYILGDYSGSADPELFAGEKHGGKDTVMCHSLVGKRLVTVGEIDGRWNTGTLKNITGGDEILVEKKYCMGFGYSPQCKLIFHSNEKPRLADAGGGMRRRMLLLKCMQVPAKVDEMLPAKLRSEAAGILHKIVQAACGYHRAGQLIIPEALKSDAADYIDRSDAVQDWLNECTRKQEGGLVTFNSAYSKSYKPWSKANGMRGHGRGKFMDVLEGKGITVSNVQGMASVIKGIKVVHEQCEQGDFDDL